MCGGTQVFKCRSWFLGHRILGVFRGLELRLWALRVQDGRPVGLGRFRVLGFLGELRGLFGVWEVPFFLLCGVLVRSLRTIQCNPVKFPSSWLGPFAQGFRLQRCCGNSQPPNSEPGPEMQKGTSTPSLLASTVLSPQRATFRQCRAGLARRERNQATRMCA